MTGADLTTDEAEYLLCAQATLGLGSNTRSNSKT
jgi:hypothetical protein